MSEHLVRIAIAQEFGLQDFEEQYLRVLDNSVVLKLAADLTHMSLEEAEDDPEMWMDYCVENAGEELSATGTQKFCSLLYTHTTGLNVPQELAAHSLSEWMSGLKKEGVSAKTRRQFKHIWESAMKRGKDNEYATRAAIDILPKYIKD